MKIIDAAFKRYNANAQDKSVGDCVKRALSYAYGVDYNEIGRQLNRIKNEIGSFAFNSNRTWTKFLKDNGAKLLPDSEVGMMEDEFAELHPHGIYIVLSGPENRGYSTHMVCIMNGDIIDSWNSSNYKVYSAWEIKDVPLDVFNVVWEDVEEVLNTYIDTYIDSLNKKADGWFNAWREDGYRVNDVTYRMKFYVRTGDLPRESEYNSMTKHMKRIVVKLNPRMDIEQNISSLKAKLKQSVYDWLYPYMKDKKDTEAILKMDGVNDHYRDAWSRKELLKLPEWVRPHVTYFHSDPSGRYSSNKYELSFKALPDDPHIEDRGGYVSIDVDTYKELKEALEDYRTKFWRSGYEY